MTDKTTALCAEYAREGLPMVDLARCVAKSAHYGQARKYTGEPYVEHCRAVAARVAEQTDDEEIIAAAWLHDTIEDTDLTYESVRGIFGTRVARIVVELTDLYTASNYPDLNRAARKELEARRLASIGPEARLVKLADIEDNTRSIVRHDPKFAATYLREKAAVLEAIA